MLIWSLFTKNGQIKSDIGPLSNTHAGSLGSAESEICILVFSHITKFGQKLLFFNCLDENFVAVGQEFYSCPVDDHLQGKNRILAQLPYDV